MIRPAPYFKEHYIVIVMKEVLWHYNSPMLLPLEVCYCKA